MNLILSGFNVPNSKTASCYNSLGLLNCLTGDYDMALEYCTNSLDMTLALCGSEANNQTVADGYISCGLVFILRSEQEKALEFCSKYLEILLPLSKEEDAHTEDAVPLSGGKDTHTELAVPLSKEEDTHIEGAVALSKREDTHTGDAVPLSREEDTHTDLAVAHLIVGFILCCMSSDDGSRSHFTSALSFCQTSPKSDSLNVIFPAIEEMLKNLSKFRETFRNFPFKEFFADQENVKHFMRFFKLA